MSKKTFSTLIVNLSLIVFVFFAGCTKDSESATGEKSNIDDLKNLGKIEIQNNNSSYLLAAPHGSFDSNTGEIVKTFCDSISWDCIVVTGYRSEEHPYNVNRPTEGVGVSSQEEIYSENAKIVYGFYEDKFKILKGAESKLYVEIHGNSRDKSKMYIEIAQVGIDDSTGQKIKNILNKKLVNCNLGDISVLWEGDKDFYFNATNNKKSGIMSKTPTAIHIELPYSLRTSQKEKLNKFLLASLPEIANLIF